jgi:succinoglycan biosynthesis transport protein ExoP
MEPATPSEVSPVTVTQPSTELVPIAAAGGSPPWLTRPQILSTNPDALALLKALRRRWVLACGLGLLLAATCGPLVWMMMPRARYTARSTVFVSLNPKRIVFDSSDGRSDPKVYQRTQVARLRNRSVLTHALGKPEVAALETIKALLKDNGDPVDWLEERMEADFPGGSEVLEVSIAGEKPDDLARIVNAVIDSYMTLVVDEEQKERLRRLEELQKLWDRYQKDLKLKRQALENLAAEIGSDSKDELTISRQFKSAQLGLIQSELFRVQNDLLKLQAEVKALEGMPLATADGPAGSASVPLDDAVEHHPQVTSLKTHLDELNRKYWEIDRVTRVKSDPSLQAAARKWQAAKRDLDAMREQLHVDLQRGGNGESTAPAGPIQALTRLRVQSEIMNGYKRTLEESANRLQKEIRDLGKGSMYVEDKREEISIANDFARKVGAEMEYARVELNAPPRIWVMARAKTPQTRNELNRVKAGAVASLASCALALLGVAFWEFRARRVDSLDDLVIGLGLQIVGALPALPRRRVGSGKVPPPEVAEPAPRVDRCDPHDASARGEPRGHARGDGDECHQGGGQDLALLPSGHEPGPRRPENPPDRRRSAEPVDPHPARRGARPGPLRNPSRRGRTARHGPQDDFPEPRLHPRGPLQPGGAAGSVQPPPPPHLRRSRSRV